MLHDKSNMWVHVFCVLSFLTMCCGSMTFRPHFMDTYDAVEYTTTNPYVPPAFQGFIRHSIDYVSVQVYYKDGARMDVKTSVLVECYDYTSAYCDNHTLSVTEVDQLSLYISMVESVGGKMDHAYSIGVIRDQAKEYTQGMYTQMGDFIAFWIRLKDNDGKDIYTFSDNLKMTLSILELAAHERGHFDTIVTYNDNNGHCDTYQRTYNTLINNAIRDVHRYTQLTFKILSDNYYKSRYYDPLKEATFIILVLAMYLYVLFRLSCLLSRLLQVP